MALADIQTILDGVGATLDSVAPPVGVSPGRLEDTVAKYIAGVRNWVQDTLTALIDRVNCTIKGVNAGTATALDAGIKTSTEMITATATTIGDNIRNAATTIYDSVGRVLAPLAAATKTAVSEAYDSIQGVIGTINVSFDGVRTALTNVKNNFDAALSSAGNYILDKSRDLGRWILDNAQATIASINETRDWLVEQTKRGVDFVGTQIADAWEGLIDFLRPYLDDLLEKFPAAFWQALFGFDLDPDTLRRLMVQGNQVAQVIIAASRPS